MKKKGIQMSGEKVKKFLCLQQSPIPVSVRDCAKALQVSKSTVQRWGKRCTELNLSFEQACEMTDDELHDLVCCAKGPKFERFYQPNFSCFAEAIDAGATKLEVFERYTREAQGSGTSLPVLKKSAFYRRLNKYIKANTPNSERIMVQEWRSGEYMQIDYAGDVIELRNGPDGKQYKARVFVCTLCFSRLTFWCATAAMTTECWLEGILKAFKYFGGLPKYILLDNDTALVNHAEVGNKVYNDKFLELCRYHGVEPAAVRPAAPRDKGMVEGAVRHVTEQFIKRVFPKSFTSLFDLNAILAQELERYNDRIMTQYGISRRQWFEEQERTQLRKLPKIEFSLHGMRSERRVKANGCVSFQNHSYLLPKASIGTKVIICEGPDGMLHFLESVHEEEICSYRHFSQARPDRVEGFMHAHPEFREPGEESASERLNKAVERVKMIGPKTEIFISKFCKRNSHMERGQLADSVNWIARRFSKYDASVVERACEHVVAMNIYGKKELAAYLEALSKETKPEAKTSASSNEAACLRTPEELVSTTIH